MKLDIEEIRRQLRNYCLGIGVCLVIVLLVCQVSPHHLLTPLVPLFISEVVLNYWRFGDPSRVAKPPGKDKNLTLVGFVVLGIAILENSNNEKAKYHTKLVVEIIAAGIALFFFRWLKLDRNPIDDWIAIENSNNIADGMAECFYEYLKRAIGMHVDDLKNTAEEQGLNQPDNKVLKQMFVLFPDSSENRCLIQHIRKMERNENEMMSVSIRIKTPYFQSGCRRESNTHLIKIRRDIPQNVNIKTDFRSRDEEPRKIPKTIKQFIYMCVADNKPLNALHDLKQRGKMPENVFEHTKTLYYKKLQKLIDNDLKKFERENEDEKEEKLKLLNLVWYDHNSEKGVFTKPILEKIDNQEMW